MLGKYAETILSFFTNQESPHVKRIENICLTEYMLLIEDSIKLTTNDKIVL